MYNYKQMIMKRMLTRLLLFAWVVIVSLGTAFAQSGTPVTIVLKKASVRDVFTEIKKQVRVNFMYSNEDVNTLPEKDYDLKQVTIAHVMEYALAGSELTFEVVNSTVIIKRKSPKKNVTGTVVDVTGMPLPGVSIVIRGTNRGTTTDINGSFALSSDKQENVHLSISYLGMRRQELAWKGRKLHIVMEEDASEIDEVVITGYQVINKRALTSAVTTVKAEDILRPDALSIDQMLEGHIPDMMFMSNSGEAGVVPKIRIRGTSSLIGNREPLWVVDGIVVTDPVQISAEELNDPDYVNRIGNAIAGLNPRDIERLDVLKDASATALYGTRAANGVIVITTKRGREGKPQIRYDNNFTFKIRPHYTDRSVDVLNSRERMQLSRELFADHYEYPSNSPMVGYEGLVNQLYKGTITDDEFKRQVAYLETVNTDWFDLLTHNSFSQQHTVSMNGGSERGTYYASIGYTDNDDVVKGTKNKRYNAMLNLDTRFTKWFSAAIGLKGNVSEREYYQDANSPVDYAYNTSRAIPAFTPDGEDYYYYGRLQRHTHPHNYNILNELDNSGIKQDGSSFTLDANLKFHFNDWLTANAIASYTNSNTDIENYWGDRTWYAAELRDSEYGETPGEASLMPQGGQLSRNLTRQKGYTLRLQLDWNKYFGENEKHNFSGGVGYEMSSTHYRGFSSLNRGYYPDRGLTFVTGIDLDKYTAYKAWISDNMPQITDNKSNTISAYATVSYNYNRMLYLNANARIDGSNNFGDRSNDKILPIWSVSASFDASKLGFIRDLEWLDFLTVKTSYGFQGNMLSSQSPVMIIQKNPMSDYYGEFTSTARHNPNPNLKWERTNSYNLGLEMSFLDNRIQLEASLYFKRTKDAFMSKNISTVNGYSSYVVNGGNISNDGYSIGITARPIRTKDWQWSLSTSFSRTINSVETLPAGEEYHLSNFLNGTAVVKGKPVGTFYSYKFLGLSPVDGGPMFDDWFDHYEDLTGLSKYDTYTRVLEASGSREPYMSGSLSSQLRYKSLRMHFTLAYSLGAKTRLFGMYGEGAATGSDGSSGVIAKAGEIRPEQNLSRDYLNRWKRPGDEAHTNIPAIISTSNSAYFRYLNHWSSNLTDKGIQEIASSYWDMYDYSDLRVVSASYLKLSSLSLMYELPKAWLAPCGISRLELNVSGSNLFTVCDRKLKGQTPTQGGFTTIQLSDRPSFSCGVSVTF